MALRELTLTSFTNRLVTLMMGQCFGSSKKNRLNRWEVSGSFVKDRMDIFQLIWTTDGVGVKALRSNFRGINWGENWAPILWVHHLSN